MSRGCPRCAAELEVRTSGGVEVDVCPLCRGIYLDEGEFDRMIAERYHDKKAESLLAFVGEPVDDPLYCSNCSEPMLRAEYDELELDRCEQCGGIWVDGDEHRDVVERARAAERTLEADRVVLCSGCGEGELERLCIRRMDAWWCEDCVVAGNHPGPEAEAARMAKMQKEAYTAMSRLEHRREDARDLAARRGPRRGVIPIRGHAWTELAVMVESAVRRLIFMFRDPDRDR